MLRLAGEGQAGFHRVFRLSEPACLQFKQIVVLATRRKRHARLSDAALLEGVRYLEMLSTRADLEPLGDAVDVRYEVPPSERVVLTNTGIPAKCFNRSRYRLLLQVHDAHDPRLWRQRPIFAEEPVIELLRRRFTTRFAHEAIAVNDEQAERAKDPRW